MRVHSLALDPKTESSTNLNGMDTMRIGQVAHHSGLTVRTLHHYDAIGLLSPSQRNMYGQETEMRQRAVLDPELMEFVARVHQAAQEED